MPCFECIPVFPLACKTELLFINFFSSIIQICKDYKQGSLLREEKRGTGTVFDEKLG